MGSSNSKNQDHQNDDEEHDQQQRSGNSRRADERTRLLPANNPRSDGYLDPDDPAVSPYNLWTVRVFRYFTVLFTLITFVWWVLLLVSIFVSPPRMQTRGSGFTDFSFTCLTLGNLFLALIFFAGPSRAMRVSMGIVSFLLLVDMIVILAVRRNREEEGWPGIASSIWALLMAVWCVVTDRVVAWGKREEEERLTGRAESRRSLAEWISVLVSTIIAIVYILIALLLTATLILRAIDAGLEPEGVRYPVDNGKYKVHFNCVGERSDSIPTVLVEAGEKPSETRLEAWMHLAWQNETVSRYCYWDRPGYAWSDNAPSPHSAGMAVSALTEVLATSGEEGPFITVSAGYGSIVSRIFSARKNVVGMMLIDPLHEDLLYKTGTASRGLELWAWGIISPIGLTRLGGAMFKGRTSEDRVYGKSVWSVGKFLKAKLQESLVADSLTKSEVNTARTTQPRDTDLVIVSSGIEVGKNDEWKKKQGNLTDITDNLIKWEVVKGAPHEVWKTDKGKEVLSARLADLVRVYKKRNDKKNGGGDDE